MGNITARASVDFQLLNGAQFTFLGRTIAFFPATMKLTGADRYNQQSWEISAAISAQPLSFTPLGISAPAGMVFFLANEPVDVRVGTASAGTFLSAVLMLTLGGNVSGLFVTTSNVTQIWLFTAGGSAAVLTATTPNP